MRCIFYKTAKTAFKFSLQDSVSKVNARDWIKVAGSKNIYLTLDYLEGLESAMTGLMRFLYVLFYDETKQPIGAAVVQELTLTGNSQEFKDILGKVGIDLKHRIPGAPDFHVLICGNIFACGENGFAHTDLISGEQAYEILAQGLQLVSNQEKPRGAFSVILLKDFWLSSTGTTDVLKVEKFRDFMIDVNMVLKLDKDWRSREDYLNVLTAKFRTKAKGVYKKSEALTVRSMGEPEIAKHIERIRVLYRNVVEKAGFRFGSLEAEAFLNFKRNLKDQFIFTGYFLKEELLGFSSSFVSNGTVDANYVGIDYEYNQEYALYQRMLYDFVDLSISSGATELRLGRTAEEIKSCLGAEPANMKLYIRNENRLSNKLLKPVFESISPAKFELRKPFKQVIELSEGEKKLVFSE